MMIRPSAHIPLAWTLLIVLGLGFARAEDTLVWIAKSSGSLVTLAYGPVDTTKAPLFLLSCFNGMDIAVLDVHQEISDGKPGEKLAIELSAGSATASLNGEIAHDDAIGVTFAEASDIKVKPVLAVLREKGPVAVKMGTTTATLAEHGRAEAVESFSQDCKLE
jgi:hypothetical protein